MKTRVTLIAAAIAAAFCSNAISAELTPQQWFDAGEQAVTEDAGK